MHHRPRFRLFGAVAALLTMSAGVALAGGHPDRARLDTNGDGSVDLAEIQAARPDFTVEKFNAADANRDGLLSRDELRAAHTKRRGQEMFTRLDKDASGGVDLPEMQLHRPGVTPEDFARLDTDGNGQLSPEELKAGHQRRHGHHDKPAEAQPGS